MSKIMIISLSDAGSESEYRFPEYSHGVTIFLEDKAMLLAIDDIMKRYIHPALHQLFLNEEEKELKKLAP